MGAIIKGQGDSRPCLGSGSLILTVSKFRMIDSQTAKGLDCDTSSA